MQDLSNDEKRGEEGKKETLPFLPCWALVQAKRVLAGKQRERAWQRGQSRRVAAPPR